MTITLTLTDLLLGLLIIAGIGALIALMVLLIKACGTIKHITKILENAATISDDAVAGVADAKVAIGAVKNTVGDVAALASANKGKLKSTLDLVKAFASLKGLAGSFSGETEDSKSKK